VLRPHKVEVSDFRQKRSTDKVVIDNREQKMSKVGSEIGDLKAQKMR